MRNLYNIWVIDYNVEGDIYMMTLNAVNMDKLKAYLDSQGIKLAGINNDWVTFTRCITVEDIETANIVNARVE